jgi:hypothetical protein
VSLTRRKALSSKTPLRRGKGLKRGTKPMRRVPLKAKPDNDYERELDAVRPLLRQRSQGRCEIGLPGCWGVARDPHHRKLRSRGGTNELRNLLDSCPNCHRRAHEEVELATALGLQVPSWMPVGPIAEVFARLAKFRLDGQATGL